MTEIQNLRAAGDIPGLIACLCSPNEVFRALARGALLAIGTPAIPALVTSLKGPDRDLCDRIYFIRSLIAPD
jgi:hypothetical protein